MYILFYINIKMLILISFFQYTGEILLVYI